MLRARTTRPLVSSNFPGGPGKPALAIDDLHVLTRATVHHGACRAPQGNDSRSLEAPASALLTWRTVVLLLPFQDGCRVIQAAALLVNPGLEKCGTPKMSAAGIRAWNQPSPRLGSTHPRKACRSATPSRADRPPEPDRAQRRHHRADGKLHVRGRTCNPRGCGHARRFRAHRHPRPLRRGTRAAP
jgi:hypothetical protein